MKKVSDNILKKLHIDRSKIRKVNTVKELIKEPPLMVMARVVRDSNLGPQGERNLRIKKGSVLTMPFGTYMTACRTKDRNKVLKPDKKSFAQCFKRYYGHDMTGKNLLIWRSGGFGDLLFLQPIIKHIKKLYPTCQITFASFGRFLGLLSDYPEGLVDKVIPVPFSANHLYNNDRHMIFEGIIERCGDAERFNAYDMMDKVVGLDIDHTLDEYKIELTPNKELLKEVETSLPSKFVVVQMRASSPIRMMSEEKWARVVNRIIESGKKVVVIDRPQYKDFYSRFMKAYNIDSGKFFNLSSVSKTINHAVTIISKSDGVVGIDSAFTHIGAALDKPVLGLYGAFLGKLRLSYYKNAEWVQSKPKCKRAQCFWHHENKFKCESLLAGHAPECMECLDEEEIMEKFNRLMIKKNVEKPNG